MCVRTDFFTDFFVSVHPCLSDRITINDVVGSCCPRRDSEGQHVLRVQGSAQRPHKDARLRAAGGTYQVHHVRICSPP